MVPDWKKSMWRSSEFVAGRWMMKSDSTDRKTDRKEWTPEYQSAFEGSSRIFICVVLRLWRAGTMD